MLEVMGAPRAPRELLVEKMIESVPKLCKLCLGIAGHRSEQAKALRSTDPPVLARSPPLHRD